MKHKHTPMNEFKSNLQDTIERQAVSQVNGRRKGVIYLSTSRILTILTIWRLLEMMEMRKCNHGLDCFLNVRRAKKEGKESQDG